MSISLADVLNDNLLRQKAGLRSYERGQDYFHNEAVRSLLQKDNQLTAQVIGTQNYQVQLWLNSDRLVSYCSCPMGNKNIFCKHCVAVGLSWLASAQANSSDQAITNTLQDVRKYLQQQDQQTLVEIILDRLTIDNDWCEQLLMTVAAEEDDVSAGLNVEAFEHALSNAIKVGCLSRTPGHMGLYAAHRNRC